MTEKIFSCAGCGAPSKASSSDDMHPDAARNKKDLIPDDIIEIDYNCKKCKLINIIYWGFNKIPAGIIL